MHKDRKCFSVWFEEVKASWDGNVVQVPKTIKTLPCGCSATRRTKGGHEQFRVVLSSQGMVHILSSGHECVVVEAQLVPLRIFNQRRMIEEPRRMIV